MSALSGKASNPVDPSDREPHEDATAAERPPVEDGTDPLRSPYAPRRPRDRVATPPSALEHDDDPLRSPYAPRRGRERPQGGPESSEREGAQPRPPETLREALGQRHAFGGGESGLQPHDIRGLAADGLSSSGRRESVADGHATDPDAAAPPQPTHLNAGRGPAAAGGSDEVDRDLERLEASLRWLQRQDAGARSARGPQPPLAPAELRSRRPIGEASGLRPLSLEPERLRPPPAGRDHMRWPLRFLIVCSVAAPVVYYFTTWDRPAEPAAAPPQLASVDPADGVPETTMQQLRPAATPRNDPAAPPASESSGSGGKTSQLPRTPAPMSEPAPSPPERPQPTRGPERERVAMVAPAAPVLPAIAGAPPAAAVGTATRTLDPEEVALLLKQGEQFIAAGDLVTARILLHRAAESGDAGAAVALGATYDPVVLARLGVLGIEADAEKARSWYQKAESLGSTEATRRLKILANR